MRARISESFKLLLMTSILIGLLLFIDICVCLPLSTVFTFRLSRQNILDSYFMPEGILLLAKKSGMPPRILYVEILNISSKEFKVIVLENYTNIRGEVGQAQFLARLPGGEILLYGEETLIFRKGMLYLIFPYNGSAKKIYEFKYRRAGKISPKVFTSPNGKYLAFNLHGYIFLFNTYTHEIISKSIYVNSVLALIPTDNGNALAITLETFCHFCIAEEKSKWVTLLSEGFSTGSLEFAKHVLIASAINESLIVYLNSTGFVFYQQLILNNSALKLGEVKAFHIGKKVKFCKEGDSITCGCSVSTPIARYLVSPVLVNNDRFILIYDILSKSKKFIPISNNGQIKYIKFWNDGFLAYQLKFSPFESSLIILNLTNNEVIFNRTYSPNTPIYLHHSLNTSYFWIQIKNSQVEILRPQFRERKNKLYALTVKVIDDKGPIANAQVSVGNMTLKADATGYATFLLPSGNYTVKIEAVGYEEVEKSIFLSQNETVEILMKQIFASLKVIAKDSEGKTITSPATVVISKNSTRIFKAEITNGTLTINLPIGTYTVSLYMRHYNVTKEVLLTKEGGEVTFVINLLNICIRVEHEDGSKPHNATIVVADEYGNVILTKHGVEEASVKLLPGLYVITVYESGYETAFRSISSESGAKLGTCIIMILKKIPQQPGNTSQTVSSNYFQTILTALVILFAAFIFVLIIWYFKVFKIKRAAKEKEGKH